MLRDCILFTNFTDESGNDKLKALTYNRAGNVVAKTVYGEEFAKLSDILVQISYWPSGGESGSAGFSMTDVEVGSQMTLGYNLPKTAKNVIGAYLTRIYFHDTAKLGAVVSANTSTVLSEIGRAHV